MKLKPTTVETLKRVQSIHKPNGFHNVSDIRKFWKLRGAIGFLNIKEITADMVNEIRTQIIEKNETGD